MNINEVLTFLSLLATITGLYEWRIRAMYAQFKEKIDDKNQVNQIVQDELKGDIARLEAKIDMLINLQIRGQQYAAPKESH